MIFFHVFALAPLSLYEKEYVFLHQQHYPKLEQLHLQHTNQRLYRFVWSILLLLTAFNAYSQSLQDKARMDYYKSMLDNENLDYELRISYHDTIISYYASMADEANVVQSKIAKMKYLYHQYQYLEAYKLGIDILESINELNDTGNDGVERKTYTHLIIAKCCSSLGMYDEGISNLYSILKYPNSPYSIEAYSHLAYVFMLMDQMEKSRSFNYVALEALAEANSIIRLNSSCKVYNNMAGYYFTSRQLDSALYYINLSIDYYDYGTDVHSKAYIYHNMAIIYQEMQEYQMAEDYIKIAIDLSDNDLYRQALYLQSLADLNHKQGNLNQAESYYLRAFDVADKINSIQIKSNVLIDLSRVYQAKQQYKKAWEYIEQGVMLRDSVFSNEDMEKISILSQQFEKEKILLEKELLEKELRLEHYSNQQKTILMIFFIILIIAISLFTFLQIRRITRKSAIHIEQETKQVKKQIRREFEDTLDEKNRQLASNALFLMRTNEMLAGLQQNIKQLSLAKEASTRKNIITEIESIIGNYNSGDQGWNEFKYYFEQVHPSFYSNLDKYNPKLSKMEQRLCALLVLNMNTKEIAQMTNRSVRTIESLIYRLRKDLNIPTDEKTIPFLRQFLK